MGGGEEKSVRHALEEEQQNTFLARGAVRR